MDLNAPPVPLQDDAKACLRKNPSVPATQSNKSVARSLIGASSDLVSRLQTQSLKAQSNAVTSPPWNVPGAWIASTAYTQGSVVLANGSWYVATIGGTSASSGTGPSHQTAKLAADGTVSWSYYGPPTAVSNDPNAPVLVFTTSNPAGSYPVFVEPINWPNSFRALGGYTIPYVTTGWQMLTFNRTSSTTANPGSQMDFLVDGDFALHLAPTSIFRVIIDGRYVTMSPIRANSTAWAIFTFNGIKKLRHIVIEGGTSGLIIRAVWLAKSSNIFPVTDKPIRAVCISDSIFAGSGYGPFLPGGTTSQLIGKKLGWDDVWNFSTGGTGYIATGGGNYTFGQRIPEALTRNPDVWILAGTLNDPNQTAPQLAAITAAVTSALTAIRSGSSAPIFVFGIWPYNLVDVTGGELAIQSAVTDLADPLVYFFPMKTCVPLPLITFGLSGSGLSAANNSVDWITDDSTHPVDAGNVKLSDWMARKIKGVITKGIP